MSHENLTNILTTQTKARLFPVGKDMNNERAITSIFLATLSAVNSYAAGILNTIGKKTGVRTNIECHTEVIFPNAEGNNRPDGLIILRSSKNTIWTALIEAKIGNAELTEDQISRYLVLAKTHKIDAVITISNQFAALPTHHPIKVSKTLTRSIELYHWSWTFLRTQADYQLRVEEDIDIEQKFLLEEMIRYFDNKSSGVLSFDRMNKEWRSVCLKAKNQERLLKSSDEILNTVCAWHQEQRDIALLLTRKLGAPVVIKLKKNHKTNPVKRLKDDAVILCEKKLLTCELDIPRAASTLSILASLNNRTITCSMEILARGDKKSTKARINWLVKQFSKIDPTGIRIGAKWPSRAPITWASLEDLKEEPTIIQTDNLKLAPHRFIIQTVLDIAGKFSGQRTFIEALDNTVSNYYHSVGENLTAWVPPAPKFEEDEGKTTSE